MTLEGTAERLVREFEWGHRTAMTRAERVSKREVAELLGCSPPTVLRMIKRQELPGRMVAGLVCFKWWEVDDTLRGEFLSSDPLWPSWPPVSEPPWSEERLSWEERVRRHELDRRHAQIPTRWTLADVPRLTRDDIWTVRDVARRLGVSVPTVRRAVKRAAIPARAFSGGLLFVREQVEAALTSDAGLSGPPLD